MQVQGSGGGGRGRDRGRGGRDNQLLGKTIRITRGPYKGTEITHSEYTVSICMWKRFMYFVDSC